MDHFTGTRPVAESHRFDTDALAQYLHAHLPAFAGPLQVEQFKGGQSNPTYKLLTAFAGDATPDLAQVGNSWLPEMQALGALEPLEPWLAGTPQVQAADYFGGIWATNAPAGRRVGLPWYVEIGRAHV